MARRQHERTGYPARWNGADGRLEASTASPGMLAHSQRSLDAMSGLLTASVYNMGHSCLGTWWPGRMYLLSSRRAGQHASVTTAPLDDNDPRRMVRNMANNLVFHGPNAGYVLELYDRFLADPDLLDPESRAFFENWTPPADFMRSRSAASTVAAPGFDIDRVLGAHA